MRTIKTTNGTYRIADSRNLEEFIKTLKKAKPPVKRAKASPRVFPAFVSGKTSTRDYVKAYYVLNNLGALNQEIDAYIEGLFGALPTTPAPDQPIEDDTIEVSLCS
jgi:phosphosulfolactate phosphohydrolase-like enzyme